MYVYIYVTEYLKRGLIHAYNFSNLKMCNSGLSYHCTSRTENFSPIACLQIKLCLIKIGKLDAYIRPPFANSVTYEHKGTRVCNGACT